MRKSRVNRREFVFGLAGTAASTWLAAHAPVLRALGAYAAAADRSEPYAFFTVEQAREFDAISAQIIPTDDTPGAREARVVRFVDRYFATAFKAQQPRMRDDLKLLGDALEKRTPANRSLASLSDAGQIAFLTEFETAERAVFDRLRALTMLGMFSHPMHGGNTGKVGWKLIGFEDRHSWTPPFGYYDRA